MTIDKDQEVAAKCLNNNSLIISGAGCGKTTTLIRKIKNLIESGVKQNEILVISFTNETVKSFINKCSYNIDVYTFHKLSLKYINNELDIAPEELLDSIIQRTLHKLPKKLKLKLYNIFNRKIIKYDENKYIKFINSKKSDSIFSCIKSIIMTIESENININSLKSNKYNKNEILLLYITKIISNIYNKEKRDNNLIDFDDMIKEATINLNSSFVKCNYKYILVDEYQDISKIRLDFLKALINTSGAILTAVGDDFQSIYGFSGSNIKLFYSFKNDFNNTKIFYIRKTYRCPRNIINLSGTFIMKNKNQMKKELISNINNEGKIKFIHTFKPQKMFMKIINKFIIDNKTTFILSRNNFDINKYTNNKIKFENSYLIYKGITYKNIRFLTIHKAKGLEADNVMIINMTKGPNGLPSLKKNNIIEKIKNYEENIKYAEERRLLYVAMTRSRRNLFFLVDQNSKSVFIKEIKKLTHKS